jgi:hypothetical protein
MLVLGCLGGCRSIWGGQGLPEDPLLFDKKPMESRAQMAPPVAIHYAELTPPFNPYFTPEPPSFAGRPQRALVPGLLTNRPVAPDEDD